MKKLLLTAAAVLAFGFANAQEVKFGAKAGVNLSNLAVSGNAYKADAKIGFHLGGFAEIKLMDKFAIQPELFYSSQGAKFTESERSYNGGGFYSYDSEDKLELGYINLPVIAKYYVMDKLSVEAGPQVGFLVNAKQKSDWSENDNGVLSSGSETKSVKNFTKGVDFGFNLGASYNFTDHIGAGLRYYIGLSDTRNYTASFADYFNGNYNLNNYYTAKNNVLSASFYYKF